MSICRDNEDAGMKLANLSRLLVQALQRGQRLREAIYVAKEVTCVAIGEIADRDRALDRARAQVADLRLQVRSLMSGRTISQQRQAEESHESTTGRDVAT